MQNDEDFVDVALLYICVCVMKVTYPDTGKSKVIFVPVHCVKAYEEGEV
jgi:hypothetical protein